jgi:hypothetical protein
MSTVFLGTFNAAGFLAPFPRSVPQHDPVSELYGQFLCPLGLVFALTCTVNCGTLYRQMYLSKSCSIIDFTTGGLQSSCRNISRMINGNRMHLSSISSHIGILFLFFYKSANIIKNLFLHCHYRIFCVN